VALAAQRACLHAERSGDSRRALFRESQPGPAGTLVPRVAMHDWYSSLRNMRLDKPAGKNASPLILCKARLKSGRQEARASPESLGSLFDRVRLQQRY